MVLKNLIEPNKKKRLKRWFFRLHVIASIWWKFEKFKYFKNGPDEFVIL